MGLFQGNVVEEETINDAWRSALWCCIRRGYSYLIQQGSYVGQVRRQLEYMTIVINQPSKRPLSVYMPEALGIPAPTDEDSINDYFVKYLLSEDKTDNEEYTYGQFICQQVYDIIDMLRRDQNQAVITIGNENSTKLANPPCLKVIDFKVVDGKLNMTVYFRSWDLFAGLPENLGGLQLLKEFILCHVPRLDDGKIIAQSSGAHIYEMYIPIVNQLNVDKL